MTRFRQFALLAVCILFTSTLFAANESNVTDLLSKHLAALGGPDVRNAKTRVVEGTATYKIIVGGSGQAGGKSVFASAGDKLRMLLKVNLDQYHGEQFISTGAKTNVAATYRDKTWSEFGDFLRGQDAPLREGLLGGVLNTTWPLLDINAHKASVSYEGLKNVEGRQLHALRYKPKKGSDLSIMLYFDPETFRHVMTVYTASRASGLGSVGFETASGPTISTGAAETESARRTEAHYRLEERFSDFQTTDGVTLPAHYDLRFTEELQNGFSKAVEWDISTTRVLNNVGLDPKNFEIP